MSAGKNSKHIQNRFFLIADKVAKGDVEIRHMGTKSMWADVNTKPVQGELFRIFRHQMMGVPINYDDDVERKNTHLLLLPKPEPIKMTVSDEQMLKEIKVLAPSPTKTKPSQPKGILRGKAKKSTSSRSKLQRDEGVCWRELKREPKYDSVFGPQWNTNNGQAHFAHLKKALRNKASNIRERTSKKLIRMRSS